MKKFSIYFGLFFGALMFNACQSDMNDELSINTDSNVTAPKEDVEIQDNITGLTKVDIPEGISQVDIYNWADNQFLGTATVENGHIWIGSTNASMSVKLYDASKRQANSKSRLSTRAAVEEKSLSDLDLGYIKDAIVYKSDDGVLSLQAAEAVNSGYNSDNFLSIFPAGKDNRNISAPEGSTNFEHDVLYTSDGNAFSIYPIYSLGWYDLTLGIFYYDAEGTRHDIDIWSMLQNNWKTPYAELAAKKVSDVSKYQVVKTENAEGYQITLPEHYVYGFYIYSNDNAQSGRFYSYSAENKCGEKHAANIVDKNGINYLSFEDQDAGDWDINDLICYVNPKIPVIDEITPEKIAEELKKIESVVVVPDNVDKIVHGVTPDSCDIEARFDGKGHDYVRIADPLKNDEEVEIDLDNMNQYCEADDMRIVTAGDETVIYCPNDSSVEKDYSNSHITAHNGCQDKQYGKVSVCVKGKDDATKDEDGKYELKIAMYPKDRDCFNKVVKHIENCEWDKLFTRTKTKK